ncbi:hypothetical protein ABZ297_16510 [Nonomuraea sp. NPDC005983]|uniref:hypothetical protein n=1 Tax=Nonomuraea sp. NPDC005983 TaxID=3155595 RepID=UPI0033B50F64
MAADGDVGTDLEVGPAQLVLDLLVALLDPMPQAVEADEFAMDGRLLGASKWLGPGQGRQRLVTIAWRQQSGQVLAKPWPLRQMREQIVESGRVPL